MLLLSNLVGTVLTGAYWVALLFFDYAATYGDTRPGTEPTAWRTALPWVIWGAGTALYAVFAWLWRRIDFAIVRRRRDRHVGGVNRHSP